MILAFSGKTEQVSGPIFRRVGFQMLKELTLWEILEVREEGQGQEGREVGGIQKKYAAVIPREGLQTRRN